MTRRRIIEIAGSLAIITATGIGLAVLRSSDREPATPATSVTTSAPAVSAGSATPSPLPVRIPGVDLAPVEVRTYRISLVFRLRNTILNGLPGAASSYTVKTVQARRGGESGLLLGVGVVPGASAAHVGRSIRGLIGQPAVASERSSGRLITVHRVPGYHLAVVDVGSRRAIVVIAPRRATVQTIARAVTRAVVPG